MATTSTNRIDHMALKVNQAFIIGLLALGFVLDQPWLVAFVWLVMSVGTIWPKAGLFKRIYTDFLRPAGLLRPQPKVDEPQPHLFAQGLGALVLTGALLAFLAGADVLAWLLVAVVVVLAAINLFAGFCLGCFVYYQLARRGIRIDLRVWHAS